MFFKIVLSGKTVSIYNRPFYIYDCDNFTKAFFWKNFGVTDFTPADTTQARAEVPKMVSYFVLFLKLN